MSVKSIGAYVVALACVLSILVCGTGGDSPTNVAIERTSVAQVAAEAATRATGPSVTQQLSTDRAYETQRASRAVPPSPSTRRSRSAAESTDASLIRTHLFRVITNYHCWLSHATKKLKRSSRCAKMRRLSTSLTLRENFQLAILAPVGLYFCEE